MRGLPVWCCILTCITALNDVLKDDWDNKLIKHHQVLVKDLKNSKNDVNDCWICTHSPMSAGTMLYLAIPVNGRTIDP